ncbi:putative ankyrin repeat protein [Chloropicon roscoffensis]|uniref:Ankyrin repeat protein n=1 Tax=Chloropicon roscoffensis TaxID=1461544 RepID=A0AAX4PKN0_9CHLO
MVPQKRKREEGTDTEPALVKALRQENEELREENEGLKLRNAKLEAGCKTPQEEDEEIKLPTEVWAIIAKKIKQHDVCSFALVSKQLRDAQVLAGRELVTRPHWKNELGGYSVAYFTEDWCAYWSRKFSLHHTNPELIKRVLCVAACDGYLQVFEKYWSQGPQEKLSKLWDEGTCGWAAFGGQLEVLKWLQAKGCPWGIRTCSLAAQRGHLEVLQWMRGQDPPCPWNSDVCYWAASKGHLDVLRWAKRQGCPWGERLVCAAAKNGHLKVLNWLIKEGYPYNKDMCREAAANGGERARKVLEWLDE